MLSWFSKKDSTSKLTVAEGLAALEQHGISKRPDVPLDDILFSTGGSAEDSTDYVSLLCTLGGECERGDGHLMSDDIWHFDTECIYEEGDYVSIVERLQRMSKGALALSAFVDHVDTEASEAWLEFDFQGTRIHWDLKVNDDWVDESVFTRFVRLFASAPSEARFIYGDLGGQDCLIGFATEAQRRALSTLTGIKFEWLR